MEEARRGQSRLRSVKEATTNIMVGYSFNYVMNITFLPIFWNPEKPLLSAHMIGVVFTITSFVRQYVVRRWFAKGD